jgi:hypothetical protein
MPRPRMTPGTPLVHVSSCNQLRQKIGVVYGNPETTTGGNALKFYASVRLDIRKIGAVKNGEQVVGNKTRVKVVKNKVAPPFRECELEVLYGIGVSTAAEIVDLASEAKLAPHASVVVAGKPPIPVIATPIDDSAFAKPTPNSQSRSPRIVCHSGGNETSPRHG